MRFRFGFARLGGERATFCFGKKYPKTIAPVAVVERTSCSFDCPALLAERRPRRIRTSMCSNMRRFPRRPAALLGTANGAFVASLPAIHGLVRSEARQFAPSANPGGCERIRSTRMCEGRVRGVAFSLVTFLLATQEKVTRAPGCARKKTGMSINLANARSQMVCPTFNNHATITVWISRITNIASTGERSKPPSRGSTLRKGFSTGPTILPSSGTSGLRASMLT